MKKEVIAGIFLVVILISCIINISYINNLSNELILLIEDAEKQTLSGNWNKATTKVENALTLWENNNTYTSIVLPHEKIDLATDSLYDLLGDINAQDSAKVPGSVQKATSRFEDIASMEQISIKSIF